MQDRTPPLRLFQTFGKKLSEKPLDPAGSVGCRFPKDMTESGPQNRRLGYARVSTSISLISSCRKYRSFSFTQYFGD
jgi:hypothetical protein